MELGPAETVFGPPHHPYTEALLSAVPTIEGEQRTRMVLEGDIPSAADPPSGCVFHTRCPRFLGEVCVTVEPPLVEVEPEHSMRCPVVLGHEGAGVVEAIGPGVTRVAVGDHVALSWAPSCGACDECLRDLPQLCSTAWPAMGEGGLLDGTTRLSRDDERVYHYSFISSFAEATVLPERSCVPIPRDVPFEVAGLVGCAVTTGVGAVWRTAGVRPGDRVAVIGCGGVGLSAVLAAAAVGAGTILAVDLSPQKLADAEKFGATDGVLWAGTPEATADD